MVEKNRVDQLVALRKKAHEGGGAARIKKHHDRGKFTARERLEMLLDKDSFEEFDIFKVHRCTNFGMEKNEIPKSPFFIFSILDFIGWLFFLQIRFGSKRNDDKYE